MSNGTGLRQQATELKNEVSTQTKAFERGEITSADFSTYMDNVETRNREIETSIKNYDRARAFRAGNEGADSGAPLEGEVLPPEGERPTHGSEFVKMYQNLKRAAVDKAPNQAFSFDVALRKPGAPSLKAQGATGLQGEGASGTDTPASIGADQYFLDGPGGPDITPQWIPGILELRWYDNVVNQLMPTFPTDSPIVSYVREHGWNNRSSATPEGHTFGGPSTNEIKRYTEQVGKVTNLSKVTDEELQDSQYFWALVQRRTTFGVTRKEEVELLAGDGYPGVNGLLARTNEFHKPQSVSSLSNIAIPDQSNPGVGAESNTIKSVTPGREIKGSNGQMPDGHQIVDGIFHALTDIRVNYFFEPTAIVMNPLDWVTVRLMTDKNGQFMAGSMFGHNYGYPQNDVNSSVMAVDSGLSLWGKRVVTTPAMPQGLIMVGDFTDATTVLRRGGMRVEIVNTHGEDFAQGLWTMRAYTRLGLIVQRPELFELIHLKKGSGSGSDSSG